MKIVKYVSLLFALIMVISCKEDDPIKNKECFKGTVVGKFPNSIDIYAVSLDQPNFNSEDSRKIFNDPALYKNIIGVVDLPTSLSEKGTKFYFKGRPTNSDDLLLYPPIWNMDLIPPRALVTILEVTDSNCKTLTD